MIVAQVLTENNEHDADLVERLLDQVEEQVKVFYGDGAYDQWKVYEALGKRKIDVIVPPRKNAPRLLINGQAARQRIGRPAAARRVRAADPPGGPKGVERVDRLPPPQPSRDRLCTGRKPASATASKTA